MARAGSFGAGHARRDPPASAASRSSVCGSGMRPGEGAPDLHRVERRDAGPRLEQLDARVGQIRAPGRGAHGQPQQQALVAGPVVLDGELGAEALPERVEEDGVLARLLGKDALGQAGDEHDVELAPARVLERADEHLPVAGGRRPLGDGGELVAQHVAHLVEGHRPDGAERAELRQHGQHALRAPEHGGGEGLEVRRSTPPRWRWRAAPPARRSPAARSAQRCSRLARSRSIDARRGESGSSCAQLFEPEAHLRGESRPAGASSARGRRSPPSRRAAAPTSTARGAPPRGPARSRCSRPEVRPAPPRRPPSRLLDSGREPPRGPARHRRRPPRSSGPGAARRSDRGAAPGRGTGTPRSGARRASRARSPATPGRRGPTDPGASRPRAKNAGMPARPSAVSNSEA